jgi:alpha-ketoglutarate-dependent taurine dioxygenase
MQEPHTITVLNFPDNKVTVEFLSSTPTLPLVVTPLIKDLDLIAWGQANQSRLDRYLQQFGAILFRGFFISDVMAFENFLNTIAGNLLEYQYCSTPRSRVSGLIYSSTEYPADQIIPLHNEESYARSWPMRLGFYCVTPADSQGETPIADSRQVYAKIPLSIRKRFLKKKIMYVRNYGTGLDLSWEVVFQTTQKSAVEKYCRQTGISFEWYGKNALRTWQVCPAVAIHPHTKETVWFNQAHLFHISNLPVHIRETLLECLSEKDLPRQAFYGDGTAIDWEVLNEIRKVYQEQTILFPWQKGDILLLDNMLTAHGRSAFSGNREVLVGMASPYSLNESIKDLKRLQT